MSAAIVYPLTFPNTDEVAVMVWSPISVVGISRSMWTGETRAMDWGGRYWQFHLSLPILNDANAAIWQAFFLKLRTGYGTFTFGDPRRRSPNGTVTGSVLVNGSLQTGDQLIVDGMGNAKTFKAGDYFSLASNLYMVMDDVTSDVSGNATLRIWPELRASPDDNAALTILNPTGVFRIVSTPAFSVEEVVYDGAEFSIVEDPQ